MPRDNRPEFETVRDAKRAIERRLRGKANVHAVSVGPKIVGGEATDALAIVVHVETKVAEDELEERDLVPPRINVAGRDPIPTDVRESELPSSDSASARPLRQTAHRPLLGGIEIGPTGPASYGTLGAPVETADGSVRLLTNRHVATTITGEPNADEWISQPTDDDDHVATLAEWSAMDSSATNQADSALLEPVDGVSVANHIASVGPVGSPEAAVLGETYLFSGRRSGVRAARVTDVDYSGAVNYDGTVFSFEELVAFAPVSQSGDSGAVWGRYDATTGEFHPVGLHFAGSDRRALAAPWSALESEHGELSPISTNNTSITPVQTTNATEVVPVALETGDRAVLRCLATRYGDPASPTSETIELYAGGVESGTPTGDVIATAETDAAWGTPEIVEFRALESTLGLGTHTVTIQTAYSGVDEYDLEITTPSEHRLYGTISNTDGEVLADAAVDAYGN